MPRTLYHPETDSEVKEIVKNYSASEVAPQPLLRVGKRDYTERLDSINIKVGGSVAWDLSAVLFGNLDPKGIRNAPVHLSFDFGGAVVPFFEGRGAWPIPGDDFTTNILAITPGGWLDKIPLGAPVGYTNRTPAWVLRDAITRVPYYNRGRIRIPTYTTPLITREDDEVFEDAAFPKDIITAIQEIINFTTFDTPIGLGHVIQNDVGTGQGHAIAWTYDADDDREVLEQWASPQPVAPDEQFTSVVARERFEDGAIKIWEEAKVSYYGEHYPPPPGLIFFVDFSSTPEDPTAIALTSRDAHLLVVEEARNLMQLQHEGTATVAFNPFLLPDDVFSFTKAYEDDTGYYQRSWRGVVEGLSHDWAEETRSTTIEYRAYLMAQTRLVDPPLRLPGVVPYIVENETVDPMIWEDDYYIYINDLATWVIDQGFYFELTDQAPAIETEDLRGFELFRNAALDAPIHPLHASEAGSGVDVGTTSTLIAAANTNRARLTIVNVSDTSIWLSLDSSAAVNEGILLTPYGGTIYELEHTGAVSAIHENLNDRGIVTEGVAKRVVLTETNAR